MVRRRVIRGAESWQFFAFIFTAAVVLEIAWISEAPNVWARLALDTLAFVGTFYTVMLNARVRNWLAGVLGWIKELERY
jgi:hypothetical protein